MSGDRMQKCDCSHKLQIRMSLHLVNGFSNKIEMILDENGRPWLKRAHLGKFLGKDLDVSQRP